MSLNVTYNVSSYKNIVRIVEGQNCYPKWTIVREFILLPHPSFDFKHINMNIEWKSTVTGVVLFGRLLYLI